MLDKVITPDRVALPENVPDRAPLLIVGDVNVLFVNVSVPARVARVPEVGSVTLVAPVTVNVVANAPLVVRLPPRVIVLVPLLTPVPPYVGLTTVPCQVPVETVPRVVIEV